MTQKPRAMPSPRNDGHPFRAGAHVFVVHCGAALAILDLERGALYAMTPSGTDAWIGLVDGRRPDGGEVDARRKMDADEDSELGVRIADFLLKQRLIEPTEIELGQR
jgi:hypothetical protein